MNDRAGGLETTVPLEAWQGLLAAAPVGMGCLRSDTGQWVLQNERMREALLIIGPALPRLAPTVDDAPLEVAAADGSARTVRFHVSRLDETHLLVVADDASGDRAAREREDAAERMEAVGRLAAGIAHDFNNVVAVIVGYSKQVLGRLAPDDPNMKALDAILRAGELAASLNRQLLALGRRQSLSPQRLDPNHAIRRMEGVLRPLLPPGVLMEVRADATVDEVSCDPTQLQQVLMNLVLNAREALAEGGRIVIETALAPQDAVPDAEGRRFISITVSDNGKGIPPDVLPRVFEPFYTTKPSSGAGLGLAVVYGIVHQSGGHVTVESDPEKGTSFRVYLPVALPSDEKIELAGEAGAEARPRGGETVLLVEDESMVARLTAAYLRTGGYGVLMASTPAQALEILERQAVDLMLTDVVMPGMSGPALAHQAHAVRPHLPIVFMSGYADDAIAEHGLSHGSRLLQKPFECATLLRVVREELDTPRV